MGINILAAALASASKLKYENIINFLLLVNAMVRVLTEFLKTIGVAKNQSLKEASEFYFVHSLCVVIILFNTDSYKSAFSTYSFKKVVFRLSVS